jgi:hypothetical protein
MAVRAIGGKKHMRTVNERIVVVAGWVIAIGLLVFFVPPAAAVLVCQWAWRRRPAVSLPVHWPHRASSNRPA